MPIDSCKNTFLEMAASILPSDMTQLRAALQSSLSRKLGGGLSWETVHHLKCELSRILISAEEWGYIWDNPALKTKLPCGANMVSRSLCLPLSKCGKRNIAV
jgi:hypothetical protein